jgi:nitronate monooxygenase
MGIGISLSGLASAVANMGGVGVISSVGIGLIGKSRYKNFRQVNIKALQLEIRKARSLTKGILGVNIMVALSNYADMVKASVDEGIDLIFSGAGLPLDLPKYLNGNSKTRLVPIVSSARAARIICLKWKSNYDYLPDAVVLEGPKAGGHLGFRENQIEDRNYRLEALLPEVIEALEPFRKPGAEPIPVIAAGGIYSGGDIHKFFKLGASGVQMGTRFVATRECDASEAFKNTYIKSTRSGIEIIKSPVGLPGRAITNNFLEQMKADHKKPVFCSYRCITNCDFRKSDYCIADALINAQMGDLDNGFAFAGENAYRIRSITTVKKLFDILLRQYERSVLKEKA